MSNASRRYAPLIALVAGAVSALGFAPLMWWPLALIGFALLLSLVFDAASLRSALWRGWLFGVAHFTVSNNWIQHAFTYQEEMPPALGYLAVVLLALYLAVYPAMAAGLAWRFGKARRGRPDAAFGLVAAAAWIVTEWLRATMFTGYAWNPLGMIWLAVPGIAQASAWVGTYALSGIAVLAAAALLALARTRQWRFPLAVALPLGALAISGLLLPATRSGEALVRVVQPNVGQENSLKPEFDEQLLKAVIAQSGAPGAVPRLIAWPEGVVNYFVEDGYPNAWYWKASAPQTRARLAALLGPRDMLLFGGNGLIFNGNRTEANAATNSVYALDAAANLHGRYDKAHLVPYGEYLPMRPILSAIGLNRLVRGDIDFAPGPSARTLPVRGFGNVGMQICYEIIFSGQVVDPAHRPDVIFNPSNDAWFGAWGPPQHLAQARMRAIEEGLPVLRSTPNGISAIVDAHGRVLAQVPRHVAGAAQTRLPLPLPPTLFSRIGNGAAFAVAALFLLAAIAIRRRAR